ncbi:MAG: sigma-70 family RNA polymerase sigma factor [Acidimicrobiia bacterium]|nr:sigma-70 family RNA polymerase sigma factor [Acidimicrobiia bacterium]
MDPIEEAYRAHHQRLWRSLLAYTGDAEAATDAAAETYSQALRRGDELVDPAAWIWRTAFRVAAGLLADRSRQWRDLESVDLDRIAKQAVAVEDPELVEFLDQLRTLSDQQRAVVVLRYSGGFTPTEIAELLDTTPNSVRVQLHRAHAHLRERIDRQ